MASFHAELLIAGTIFRVVHCQYACYQATDGRGRAVSKVRPGLLNLVVDVPDNDQLLAWAATPHKPLSGQIVFYSASALMAHETLAFTAGECVGYAETFDSGASGDGSYVCHLTIATQQFEWRAGGPASVPAAAQTAVRKAAAVAQAALTSGPPVAAIAQELATQVTAQETSAGNAGSFTNRFGRVLGGALSPALATMLDTVLLVAPTAGPNGPADFEAATKADLQAIYNTAAGKQLLESLAAAGRKIYINHGEQNRVGFPYNAQPAFYQADGVTPGQGAALTVEYNPFVEKTGDYAWNERPPAIGLAHELIHAEQAAHGRMRHAVVDNPGGPDPNNSSKPAQTYAFELEAVGVPPYDTYPVSENKIRSQWNPPQPVRTHY